ncbi:MAG: HNH endonuclease domain-containing protein [Psychroflexus sp.]
MNQLPFSPDINNNALASIFNYTSATYKFYWFLGIIEEIELGSKEIQKEKVFARMIANAWYPIDYFKLSFGSQDKIAELINDFKITTSINLSHTKLQIYQQLINTEQSSLQNKLFHLDKNVPHKFLSPWFKGSKKAVYEASKNDYQNSIYRLSKNKISINDNWFDYIRLNAKIIKDFIFWNLALFIQVRNPSTPNILNKLIKPAKRNSLTKQRQKFWNIYLKEKPKTRCIFTDQVLDINNYHVDHFVPYSFVSHDLIWNLVPIDPSFNGTKSNHLPSMKTHFEHFYNLQKDAIEVFGEFMPKTYKEEYLSVFPDFNERRDIEFKKFKDVVSPLITVAHNNGFEYLK